MKKAKQDQLEDFAVIDLERDKVVTKNEFTFEVLEDSILITNNDPLAPEQTTSVKRPSNKSITKMFFGYLYDAGLNFPVASVPNSKLYARQSFLHSCGFIDNDINRRFISLKEIQKYIEKEKGEGREILVLESDTRSAYLYFRRNLNTWLYEPFVYFCDDAFNFSETLKRIQEIKDINLITEIESDFDNGVTFKEVYNSSSIFKLISPVSDMFDCKVDELGDLTVLNIRLLNKGKPVGDYTPIYVAKRYGSINKEDKQYLSNYYK